MRRYLIALFAGLLFASIPACVKDEVDDSDNGYPMQLATEKPGRNVLLTWTLTKVSNFEHYVIVRSTEPIPDVPTPPSGTIATIDDYAQTSFEDPSFPLTKKVYYKVYAKVGDRFLQSPTVAQEIEVKLLDISLSNALIDPINHVAFLFDGNAGRLYRYDYLAGAMTDTLQLSGAFNLKLTVGNHGNGNELYLVREGSGTVEIYDADNLNLLTGLSVGNNFIFSVVSGNNGFLYVATDNWQKSFSVYRRSNKQLVDYVSLSFSSADRRLGLVSPDGLEVAEVGFPEIRIYKLNDQGTIEGDIAVPTSPNFFGAVQKIVSSPGHDLFIPEIQGSVFNRALEFQGTLGNNQGQIFNDFAFSAAGDKIWALPSGLSEIREFEVPSFSQTHTFPLNYLPFLLERDGNAVVIVGFVTQGLAQKIIVDRFEME